MSCSGRPAEETWARIIVIDASALSIRSESRQDSPRCTRESRDNAHSRGVRGVDCDGTGSLVHSCRLLTFSSGRNWDPDTHSRSGWASAVKSVNQYSLQVTIALAVGSLKKAHGCQRQLYGPAGAITKRLPRHSQVLFRRTDCLAVMSRQRPEWPAEYRSDIKSVALTVPKGT